MVRNSTSKPRLIGILPNFEYILQAILGTKTALESEIDSVSLDIGLLHTHHHKLAKQVDDTESTLTSMSPIVQDLQSHVKEMNADIRSENATDCALDSDDTVISTGEDDRYLAMTPELLMTYEFLLFSLQVYQVVPSP
ncbi:hypothetical protein NDU88_001203 [Pleurodeles waltl]|uniref:Uncharacterized protein n=1 Tax=Pleurodeles waltl TaxID=8319 RepID=A0AAV7WK61_PLEWA|nr:hypothetical protein NDU88_001203 [Pleurodeles waltl]